LSLDVALVAAAATAVVVVAAEEHHRLLIKLIGLKLREREMPEEIHHVKVVVRSVERLDVSVKDAKPVVEDMLFQINAPTVLRVKKVPLLPAKEKVKNRANK
jgi:hypothetical protein